MVSTFAAALATLTLTAPGFTADSGLKVGELVSAFHPTHVAGPHKGTDACPPCTWGNLPMVQVWVNNDDPANVAAIAKRLDEAMKAKSKSEFKAFMIVLTDKAREKTTASSVASIAAKHGLNNVAMAYLPKSDKAISDYKVNLDSSVKNTVFVYRNRKVADKMVNLKADASGLSQLSASIDGITK